MPTWNFFKEHVNALPRITPVPMSSRWVLSISHLCYHTRSLSCSILRCEDNLGSRGRRLPHTNRPITAGTDMALGAAASPLLPGTVQRARPAWGTSSMPSGCLREAGSLHPETHTWLAQAPPNYHGAQIFLPGALNPGHSQKLTAEWGGAGGEGPWAPK